MLLGCHKNCSDIIDGEIYVPVLLEKSSPKIFALPFTFKFD